MTYQQRVWARELAERCTVNAVAPGPMDTGLYSGLPDEPREALRPLNILTPLAEARPGVDVSTCGQPSAIPETF